MGKQRFKKRKKQSSKQPVKNYTGLLFLGMFRLTPNCFDNEENWKL